MEFKRFLSAVLSVVIAATILCTAFTVEVFATEETAEVETDVETEEIIEVEYVADTLQLTTDYVIDPTTSNVTTITVEYIPEVLYAGYDFSDFMSLQEAGLAVRENFKNRVHDFTVFAAVPTADYKQAYLQLLFEAENHTGNPIEGDYLVWQTGAMELAITPYVYNGNYFYAFHFMTPYYTTAQQEAELDIVVNQILDSLNLYNASDYDKVKGIYDYLCQNVTYDYANANDETYTLKHSAYAALVNKTAVCQGYALAFYRLALSLGVDARIIGGTARGGAHDWNIVELGGRYFDLDSTWDAGRTDYRYFLKCEANFTDHIRYDDYLTDRFTTCQPVASSDYYEAEFTVIDGTLISYNGNGGNVTVPETVTTIGEGAFRNESGITSITVPASVITVEDNAFDCNIEKITFKSENTFISYSYNTIGANAVICGHADSTAKAYADMFGRAFEEIAENNGDIDGDGVVDNNDAVYLLYAAIFGTEEYPVSQECDYNHNGMIDEEDATYLLYHTLFGEEMYPLSGL